jgi:tRNA-splicing ligase RtcB
LDCADVSAVSEIAKERGLGQLGTLGGGNHFLDVLIVDEVFDKRAAERFGLKKGQVVVMIHCGSRGLGHQVASDYIKKMGGKGLVGVPFRSEVGQKYFGAMCAAANFAFANKQVIACEVEDELRKFFPDLEMEIVYEVCHNIAKVEHHSGRDVLVMRKGATRAFGAGRVEICEDYRDVGQPILLPGSMGTFSYVLVGGGKKDSWESCSHGAGRALSRKEASGKIDFEEVVCDMERKNVFVEGGKRGVVEEAPGSYKNIEEVSRVCEGAGLGKRVVRLRPRMVVIG